MLTESINQNTSKFLASPILGSTAFTIIPGFSYPGGKKRLRNDIVSLMPKSGGTYAEPCAGRGALYFKAASTLRYSNWWLNDLRTADFFRTLVSHGNIIQVPAHTREEFERCKLAYESGDSAASILIPYFTFNGGGFGAGFRSSRGCPTQAGYERTLRSAHQILIQTKPTITALDWKKVHAKLKENDFALYDPPYLGAKVHGYQPDDINYAELIDALKTARYRWILCGYLDEAYVRAFGSPFWTKSVQLCATNFRHDGGKEMRTECLWRNF
jgi:site-specific DNA-adenine methylase